ncbi:hypothetical protein CIK84_07455 [Glutamicibacter arilaitensis]|uniref:Uncharacterized protein n=1 Tax=Glutamicibacter arilaitensis TaxID=256701 RepID=A0A2N7S5G0_9MICC|nr:hypothetical protein CIK84_07455 [Glutamicibacter arilaitensis]
MYRLQEVMLNLVLQVVATSEQVWGRFAPKLKDSRGDVPGWTKIFRYYMKKPPAMKLRAFLTVAS